MTEKISSREFEVRCLQLIDKVRRTKKRIVITKRNRPVAELVPVEEEERSLFGIMKGTIHILGDILAPIDPIAVQNDSLKRQLT